MVVELVCVSDARSQVRGEEDGKRDGGGQESGGDAGGVFGAWDGDDETGVGGRSGAVGDRVDVDGIRGSAPGLNLLGEFLGMGGAKTRVMRASFRESGRESRR